MNLAYLHGFASSSKSRKGLFLKDRLAERGVNLHLPDLNLPSFSKLTYSAMLAGLDDLLASHPGPWGFIGSSLGGYLAARCAELNPGRVERLVLLCPGFDMKARWPELMGEEAFTLWKRNGGFFFPDATGEPTPVHWGLIEDCQGHPTHPSVPCPTRIIHGSNDEVVPVEYSRDYAATRDHVELVEVEDGHELTDSMARIADEVVDWFSL
jgi:pimeloyl-ACP methyl ester carboxylesterase